MRKVTIKGLLAHKLRLALTSLAIVLGVTFISGTFVLTDTLHNMFTSLVGNIYQKIDFEVRGVAQFPGNSADAVRNPLPERVLATVRRVPGVEAAYGEVVNYAQFVSHTGQPIATGAEPTLGENYDPDPRTSELRIVQGRPPETSHDVLMDAGTAKKYHFSVGQHVRVLFGGPTRTFTITGIVQFGTADNLAGVTLAAFTLPTAQVVLDEVGQFDHINVVTRPGADKAAVERSIARALPPGAEVVTGQTVVNEQTSSINQALSFFSTALLVFAFISLFVGAFTIFNTFSITVGQRTRGAGPAARRRRQPPPGVPLGARGGRHRRCGLFAHRYRPRCARRHRARGIAQCVRFHAAIGPAGVRSPDRGGRPDRRGRGDGGLRYQPGAPGRARPAHCRHYRPPRSR